MSKQWGHGFHKGAADGLTKGQQLGETVGGLMVGEYSWHCCNAAINSLQAGNDTEALMVLRALKFMLAHATGRDVPSILQDQEQQNKTAL